MAVSSTNKIKDNTAEDPAALQNQRVAKILVVDDRPENLLAFEALLEPLGSPIVCVNSGAQALKSLLEDEFAVILLDVQMPVMDGFETASLIKERQRTKDVPIIFVTAIDIDPKYVSKAYHIGAVDYLTKPIVPEILRTKIRIFLDIFTKEEAARQQSNREKENQQKIFATEQKSLENFLRARHEDELAASSAELRQYMAALDCTHDLIALFDQETLACVYSNQGAYKTLGYTRDEMSSLLLTDIMPGFHASIKTAQRLETEYKTKDDLGFPVEVTLQIVNQPGMRRRWATIARDITERRIVESRLAEGYARERRIADVLQKSMLLTPPDAAFPGLSIGRMYEAASDEASLGGDFYDVLSLEGGKIALIIGDVTGKGLAAAARTAEVKYALRAYLKETGKPATALARLNEAICLTPPAETGGVESFVCVGAAIYDPVTQKITFSTAGIEPPAVIRAHQDPEVITTTGLPLGVLPNNDYEEYVADFCAQDIVLMVTDGITEARNAEDMFGFDRMIQCVEQNANTPDIQEIGRLLLSTAKEFAGGKLHDDACILIARCCT